MATNYGYTPTGFSMFGDQNNIEPDAGSIIDPTYLEQMRILNRPQVMGSYYNLLGSGLIGASAPAAGSVAGTYPTINDWRAALPATQKTTMQNLSSGGGSSSYDRGEPSAWDSMSDAEKAAYYAENPTMAKITQTLQSLWGYTMPGMIQNAMNPEFVQNQQLIAMGINPATASRGTGLIDTVTGQAPVASSGVTVNPATGGINVDYGLTTGMNLGGEGLNVPSYGSFNAGNSGVSSTPSGGISVDYGLSTGNDGLGITAPSDTFGYAPSVPSYSIAPDTPTSGIGLTAPSDPFGFTPSVPSYSSGGGDSGGVSAPGESGWGSDIGSDNDGYGDSGSDGGGGGGGGKIVCTAMNEAYGFGSFRNRVWIKYARDHLSKAHEVGYHTLFLPLVNYGYRKGNGLSHRVVRAALENIARHRGADLRAEMRGSKRDTLGRFYRMILEPLCYAVGKLKGY